MTSQASPPSPTPPSTTLFGPASGVSLHAAPRPATSQPTSPAPEVVRKEVIATTSMEGGSDVVDEKKKKEILDESDRPRFEDSRGERVFCFSVGLVVSAVGVLLSVLIAVGIIGIGDGTQTHHIVAKWVAFPIVLGVSLLVGIACAWMMIRECRAVRVEKENEQLETEMQEHAVATQEYKKLGDNTSSNDIL